MPRKKAEDVVEVVEEKATTKTTTKKNDIDLTDILAQMKAMQEQIVALQNENTQLKSGSVVESTEDINSDTEILVTSQTVGSLNLSTDGYGLETVYVFDKFGDDQYIPFGDLKNICKNMPKFAQQGLFYIENADAVKKLRLTRYYERMIDSMEMKDIFKKSADAFIETYKMASDLQKEQIIALVVDKKLKGERVDMNVLDELERLSGKKLLDIEAQ